MAAVFSGARPWLAGLVAVLLIGGVAAAVAERSSSGCARVPLDVRAEIGSRVRKLNTPVTPDLYLGYRDGSRWYVRTTVNGAASASGLASFAQQDFVVRGGKGSRTITSVRVTPVFDVPVEKDDAMARKAVAKVSTCHA